MKAYNNNNGGGYILNVAEKASVAKEISKILSNNQARFSVKLF